jgi:diguanylate cyclase (GGDEF)-like protein/PAS domain S-box-containing protein
MSLFTKFREEWSVFTPVKAEVIRQLYQNKSPQITAFVLALLFAIAISRTSVALSQVYLWLVMMIVVYLGRAVLSICYDRTKALNIFWLNRFRIATIITSVAWASSANLLFQPGDALNQSIILFALTGLCTGAAISYAIDYIVLFGFLLPVTLSMFFRLISEGSEASISMSLMVVLFIAFIIAIARKTNKDYIKNIELVKMALLGESREKAYSHIMEMIAKSASLDKILAAIALNFEKQNPSMLCSILLLDNDGKHLKLAAAPSLPDFYNEAVNGLEIGPNIGSCGAAAYSGEQCVVEDMLNHPNWRGYTELTIKANLRACWSHPIKDSTDKVLGTFAIYHNTPAIPTERDSQTIAQNAALAGIAIGLAQNYHEQRLATLFYQNTNESMMITDRNNIIIAVNPAFTTDTGYSAEETIGRSTDFLKSDRHNEDFYRQLNQELNVTGKWEGEVWNRHKNGDAYVQWIRVSTIYSDDGNVLNHVSIATDITKRKESEDIIWKQANFDELTGLPNRRMFYDRFQQEIKISHRVNLPLALLFIDLDEFKDVNDVLGHALGDILLKETAERLTTCVRESDTIAVLDSVARLGGDEFTIMLTHLTDIECVERIAERILKKIAEPYQLEGEVAYITASIGITLYPNDATDIETLLKNADQAMYAAKRDGKNKFSYYTKSMQENAQNRMRLSKDIRSALEKQEFHLVYQPIINLRNSKVIKAEALIRWQHPTKGLVSPAEFIPIAENNGLIHDIGNWIFHEALAQATAWRKTLDPNFQISINKSPVQFQTVTTPENKDHNWVNYLRQHSISGDAIAVEITEGLLLDSHQDVHQHLLDFRDAGIQVALDDFGTGYSSLSYLKKFDIDYIKIDQSFVQNIEHDSDNMVLCQAIIVMAHKLNLKVIAEGIETQEQLDLLKFAGCDFGQGYFLSKPLTAKDFEDFMSKKS